MSAWHTLVAAVKPHVVKIELQDGSWGTGFFCARYENTVGIATANHVIRKAATWKQPIRITHADDNPIIVKPEKWAPLVDPERDAAVVCLFRVDDLNLPEDPPSENGPQEVHEAGSRCWMGWLPRSARRPVLFLRISERVRSGRERYFLDGTSIPGVSGGPVFCNYPKRGLEVIGSVTAFTSAERTVTGLSIAAEILAVEDINDRMQKIFAPAAPAPAAPPATD